MSAKGPPDAGSEPGVLNRLAKAITAARQAYAAAPNVLESGVLEAGVVESDALERQALDKAPAGGPARPPAPPSDLVAELRAAEDARRDAELVSEAKSEFMANLSHELRTPLTAIIGFSELLEDGMGGRLSALEQADYVRDINTAGRHLLGIVNDLIDMVRIERGVLEIGARRLDVTRVVASCRRLMTERAEDAGITLESHCVPNLPALYADELRVKQTLINVLTNAVKFTNRGGRIDIRAGLGLDGGITIKVEDTGIGIAPEHIEVALSDFGQVDGSRSRQYEGLGLGLALCRRMMELHQGTIALQSSPGEGTRVTLAFPPDRSWVNRVDAEDAPPPDPEYPA